MNAMTTDERAALVEAAIKGISHIATLPEITLKIIELVEDPTSTAQDLHNLISNDPALCSRILKVVNSAFYGLPRQIGSINRAIVLLGLNAVKNIAIAASLTKLFRGGDLCPNFSARDLWIHSIATAAAAKLICDELRLGLPDEAFLAGLIHDIGILVEMQAKRTELIDVFTSLNVDENGVPQQNMLDLETKIIGATHCEFGAALCESWKFPQSFSYVVGHHHDPMSLPERSRLLTALVHIADKLAAEQGYGFRGDVITTDVGADMLREINMTPEQYEVVKIKMPEAYEEVQATFG
jgi:putative nucleotidyltransferase with HDIG domain